MQGLRRACAKALFATVAIGTWSTPADAAGNAQFGNKLIHLEWRSDANLSDMRVVDHVNGRNAGIAIQFPFVLHLADGSKLTPADLVRVGEPRASIVAANPRASRAAERKLSTRLQMSFADKAGRFRIDWTVVQVAGMPYLRVILAVVALRQDERVARIDLLKGQAHGAEVVGRVAGSPIIIGADYLQFEDPLSKSAADIRQGSFDLWIERELPLFKGKPVAYSAAIGTTSPGQLRRDFQLYVESERAHPYRSFLHYNSWYDIGYFTPYTADQAVERINTFCRELTQKRGAKLDSFLFDDGWDDRSGSWNFSKYFPDGFIPLRKAASACKAAPGIWLSPWGGYSEPKAERVAAGGKFYETIDGGFALSGPKYFSRFRQVTMDLVVRQGVNQFKFDGTGNANKVVSGSQFNSDFDAAIALIKDLRAAKPDLFINLTTGTYPSPSWLRYADTIWRGGDDHNFAGVGTDRERWITYRDQQTYKNDVIAGPLFPLNSLMLHGIIYAQHAARLDTDPGNDFSNEVHSYFGSGTELQELYVTPGLLSRRDWDILAQAARWSRSNADVLKDTHWLGGDPGRLQVYGWAAWSSRKSIITLRNPADKPQSYLLDLARALELPRGATRKFTPLTIWPTGARLSRFTVDRPSVIKLAPFEVLTFELYPQQGRHASI